MDVNWSLRAVAEKHAGVDWVRSLDPRADMDRPEVDLGPLYGALRKLVFEEVRSHYKQEAFVFARLVGSADMRHEAIDTPATTKRGFVVPVTAEAIFYDRTHLVVQRSCEVGEVIGLNKEKRIIDCVLRHGGEFNRLPGNELHSAESADAAYRATGVTSGEAIVCPANSRIAAEAFANGNWYESRIMYRRLVAGGEDLIQAKKQWFYGDFEAAFAYATAWSLTAIDAPLERGQENPVDIALRFRVSELGEPKPRDLSKVVHCTG